MLELRQAALTVDLPGHRAEFVNWGYYPTRPWRNYLHIHSFYEICYVYAGRGSFQVGSDLTTVTPGTVFVARPGDVHEIISSDDDPLGIYFWAFTLVRHPGSFPPGGGDEPADHAVLADFAAPSAPRVSTDSGQIPQVLELLGAEAHTRRAGRGEMLAALARMLVIGTARAFTDTARSMNTAPASDPAAARQWTTIQTMERYVKDNYDRAVSVRDVAAQVHLSPRHAARLFKRVTGCSIHAYLARVRLEVAAQRLTGHADSIKEIAHACGYPDVRHFTTVFRRHWGTPPARFRRRNGTVWVDSSDLATAGPPGRADPTPLIQRAATPASVG